MNWAAIAIIYPEFVEWVVQRHGLLPDGEVQEDDYTTYVLEYIRDYPNRKEDQK